MVVPVRNVINGTFTSYFICSASTKISLNHCDRKIGPFAKKLCRIAGSWGRQCQSNGTPGFPCASTFHEIFWHDP